MKNISKIVSGFPFLDENWGGIFPGGNYLVFGPIKSGKSIFALNLIENFTSSGVNVLLLTSERDKNIEIQTSSILFDIEEQVKKGMLQIEKLNASLSDYNRLKNIILEINPVVLFIDEIINIELKELRSNYTEFIDFLEKLNITSFFFSSIPRSEQLKSFLKIIVRNSTGIIYFKRLVQRKDVSGLLTIRPNIGHFEGEFQTSYRLLPGKGIITESENISSVPDKKNIQIEKPAQRNEYQYTNLYSVDEFNILIESKKAYIEKSEKLQYLIKYEVINEGLETEKILNTIGNLLEKGDKFCRHKNEIFILPLKSDSDWIQNITDNINSALSSLVDSDEDFSEYVKWSIQILKSNFKIG